MIEQKSIAIPSKSRGFHLVTREILSQLGKLPEKGLLNLFLKHTSAGLCINENADPSVRHDLNQVFDRLVPEDEPYYTHTMEGSDDMPAHAKTILTGNSLSIPIRNSRLDLGTWQGIYFCEFRDHAGNRKILATIYS